MRGNVPINRLVFIKNRPRIASVGFNLDLIHRKTVAAVLADKKITGPNIVTSAGNVTNLTGIKGGTNISGTVFDFFFIREIIA